MTQIAVLIMAAGESSRFGSCKQLVQYDGKNLLQRMIDEANAVTPDHVFVVTGSYHQEIQQNVSNAQLLFNPNWQDGLGCSIAFGVSQIRHQLDGVLLVLADQVQITESHLIRFIEKFHPAQIVSARYSGTNGVPALFPKIFFDYLCRLEGDKGAKNLLNKPQTQVISLSLPEAAVDIDTPSDFKAAGI